MVKIMKTLFESTSDNTTIDIQRLSAINISVILSSFIYQLETKASSHEGQCIPAGYCHAHMLLYESGVNYNVNGKYTMRPNFYVLEYFHHTLATLVAPSTDGTAICLVSYKAHLVL